MRVWLLVLMILIANVFMGPLVWIGTFLWGVAVLYHYYKKAFGKDTN